VITLNGQPTDLGERATVAGALEHLGLDADARGVAVSVDGEVVVRGEWETFTLPERASVEVLGAMQGG
jgi:sulfur carrier protein